MAEKLTTERLFELAKQANVTMDVPDDPDSILENFHAIATELQREVNQSFSDPQALKLLLTSIICELGQEIPVEVTNEEGLESDKLLTYWSFPGKVMFGLVMISLEKPGSHEVLQKILIREEVSGKSHSRTKK